MVDGQLRLFCDVVCKRENTRTILIFDGFRVKNSGALHRTFNVEPLYLKHENSGLAIDYMVRNNYFSVLLSNLILKNFFSSTGKFR